jgi:hypothetical protein
MLYLAHKTPSVMQRTSFELEPDSNEVREIGARQVVLHNDVLGTAMRAPGPSLPSLDSGAALLRYQGNASKVVVKIREPGIIQRFRALNDVERLQVINQAITSPGRLPDPGQTKLPKIDAVRQLKSGDLELHASAVDLRSLKANTDWLAILGTGADIVTDIYKVIMNSIAVNTMDLDTAEGRIKAAQELYSTNAHRLRNLHTSKDIVYIGWLGMKYKNGKITSAIVEMNPPNLANEAIREELHWREAPHTCSLYSKLQKIKQCFNCWSYGHIGSQCTKHRKICGKCSG